MFMFLVTVKLPKNPEHNPHMKVTGPCPVNGDPCTDVTGEHHTYLMYSATNDIEVIRAAALTTHKHVTRIEAA